MCHVCILTSQPVAEGDYIQSVFFAVVKWRECSRGKKTQMCDRSNITGSGTSSYCNTPNGDVLWAFHAMQQFPIGTKFVIL